jgi:hypothetical protein
VVADAVAQPPVRRRAADLLDPRVLIGWDTLCRQLPAEPVVLLGQHDPVSAPRHRQCGGDAAEASPDDEDVNLPFGHCRSLVSRPAAVCMPVLLSLADAVPVRNSPAVHRPSWQSNTAATPPILGVPLRTSAHGPGPAPRSAAV